MRGELIILSNNSSTAGCVVAAKLAGFRGVLVPLVSAGQHNPFLENTHAVGREVNYLGFPSFATK